MSAQSWVETLVNAQSDGTALNTSTTATSILPAAAKYTLPANFFYIGRRLRITGMARVSNIVTTPGTLTLDVRFGSVIVFNGAAMQLSTTAHTTLPLVFEILLTCRAIGASTSANLMGYGTVTSQTISISGADTTTGHSSLVIPNSAPAAGTGFDSTASQAVDLFAKFSISNAANGITLHEYALEAMN